VKKRDLQTSKPIETEDDYFSHNSEMLAGDIYKPSTRHFLLLKVKK